MMHTSVIWIDGEETEEELPGVCALRYREGDDLTELVQRSRRIYGDGKNVFTALIASDSMEWGQDDGEIILTDPVVIRTF